MPTSELSRLLRSCRHRRGIQLAVALSAGMAIAVTTTAVTLLQRLTVSPLPPTVNPALVAVFQERPSGRTEFFTFDKFSSLASRSDLGFTSPAAVGYEQATVTTPGGAARRATVGFVSDRYFQLLNVSAARGRLFTDNDHQSGAAPVVVLAYDFWRRELSKDPAAVGRTLTLGRKSLTIVGVAAADFRGTRLTTPPALYIPLHQAEELALSTANYFGRAGSGEATLRWLTVWAESLRDHRQSVTPLRNKTLNTEQDSFITVNAADAVIPIGTRNEASSFTATVGLLSVALVVIAAATSAMWILLDLERRVHEVWIKVALGASTARVAVGSIVEAVVPHVAGLILAVPLYVLLTTAVGHVAFDDSSLREMISLDPTWVGAGTGGAVFVTFSAIAVGLMGRAAHSAHQRRTSYANSGRTQSPRTRRGLVAAQVSCAICLLSMAVAFNRSLAATFDVDLDYSPELVESAHFDFTELGYSKSEAEECLATVTQRLRVDRSVSVVGIRAYAGGVTPRGKLLLDAQRITPSAPVSFAAVEPSYFAVFGATVLKGRSITAADRHGMPLVAVVSRSLASSVGQDSILGRRITVGEHAIEVVGIVSDIVLDLRARQRHVVYLAYAQHQDWLGMNRGIVLKGTRPGSGFRALRTELVAYDPALSASIAGSTGDKLRSQVAVQRFGSRVISLFAIFAVVLALAGAYVLASSLIVLKRRDLAVRYALGATGGTIAMHLLRYLLSPITAGALLGGMLYYWIAGAIQGSLKGVSAADPVNVVPASVLLTIVICAVAAYAVRGLFNTEYLTKALHD